MRTRIASLLLSTTFLLAGVPTASASEPPLRLYINEREIFTETPPVIRENRTLVPMRSYLESLGAAVHWEPPDTVTAALHGQTVQLKIGQTTALVNGQPVSLDVPAQLINDRTYLPLRFLSERLGAQVDYDGQSVRVTVSGPPKLVVVDGPLNVRQGPSTSTAIITTVPTWTVFDLIRTEGGWAQVRLARGRTGWVAMQYTRSLPPQPITEPFRAVLEPAEGFLQIGDQCVGATPVINDRLHVPLRQAVERLGGTVTYEGATVAVRLGSRSLTVTPDRTAALRNGQPYTLTLPPLVIGGQVFISARDLASALELPLGWSEELRTASLGSAAPGPVCNPVLPVNAYVIMDAATGVVLSEYRSRDPFAIASTTKIMTALLALERGDPSAVVTVSPNASNQPGTSVYLRAGERRTLGELLYGLMVVSGNDAATAIAEHLAGSESAFAQIMNQRARELGATSTLFLNASGLDDWVNPYSTARDLAVISRYALQVPEFRVYSSPTQVTIPGPSGPRVLKSRNDFLLTYPGATGVKNGWTEKANHTLVASAVRGDRELIVVVLGAKTREALYQHARMLMDHGFKLAGQSWLLQTAS